MELKLYSIRDSKGGFFNAPFIQKSHGEAERTLLTLSKDEKSMISKYPEDFDLYYLGLFDDYTGKSTLLDAPQHMVKAVNLKVSTN